MTKRPTNFQLALLPGAALAIAILLSPASLSAQGPGNLACAPMTAQMPIAGRASPYDSVSTDIGGGRVKVCYGRPSVLGRTLVGGTAHPYGQPWRMGANEPTVLHTSVPLLFGDIALEPGSYSIYAIPGATQWEIVVNRSVNRWGIPISAAVRTQDIGSVTVPMGSPPAHVEVLTIRFGPPAQGRTPLVVEWENFRVSIPLGPAPR